MATIKTVIHWVALIYYIYVFGYASLFKVFQKHSMMQSMQSLGFNKTWTILIGLGELIGILLVVIGIFKPHFKNFGILVLFPFAVGAFTAHMAHNEYHYYYQSLLMCVITFVLLATDDHFKIIL